MWELDGQPEILSDEGRTLLAHEQSRRVRVRAQVILHDEHPSANAHNILNRDDHLRDRY